MTKKVIIIVLIIVISIFALHSYRSNTLPNLKVIAIANYGPHSSLTSTINGFKRQLEEDGYEEDLNIKFEIMDVGFDSSLIPQMLTSLQAKKPEVMLVMTTPVAQAAKAKIKDTPLVFSAITDPVEAGLLRNRDNPEPNITGSSDMQDLTSLLKFAKSIIPQATRVGILYSTSEANDAALVKMMNSAAAELSMIVVAIPVEQARDVATRVLDFKDKVDFIYVGTSGPIQPTLPTIAAEAKKMNIPVFNVEAQAVKDGLVLASHGVNYDAIGRNAGKLAVEILKGEKIQNLKPIYPTADDHIGIINEQIATDLNLQIPSNLKVVE